MAIDYIHRPHHRSRTLRLSITHQGQVVVSAPAFISPRQIDNFISQHQDWIQKSLAKFKTRPVFGVTAEWVMLFGKKYFRRLETDTQKLPGVTIEGESLLITQAASLTPFLKSTAAKYILPRTHQLAEIMNLSFKNITLRQQKSRWGSCSAAANLNFNWRLVHCPTAVIDYVIIHELAHLLHMNHGGSFWQLVGRYSPDYPLHKAWLSKRGLSLE